MSFTHLGSDALPPLAWLFQWSVDGQETLIHGKSVSVDLGGFFEGISSDAANVFGSGMRRTDTGWLVVTPSHTLECVFLCKRATGWAVSNSLALLLERYGLELPWRTGYGALFASACLGIRDYQSTIFRTAKVEVSRVLYDNVELSADTYRLVPKPAPPRFKSYGEYVGYLESTLRKAFTVGAGRYRPLATCSTGYDSAAGAALACRLGCSEALTISHSRSGESDSGKPVGDALGMKVTEVERPQAVDGSFEGVAPFLATGMGGEDYCYRGFAPFLEWRILLTGFHGGKLWDLKTPPNNVLARGDISGSSLQEFRLRHNFVHIPVPMIAAVRHADISSISHSPEMAPYRLGNDYDRPIPRRLLEESGVDRELFGQRKKAASLLLHTDPSLLGDKARKECAALLAPSWRRRIAASLRGLIWRTRLKVWLAINKRLHIRGAWRLGRAIVRDPRIFGHSHIHNTQLFCAAVASLRQAYRLALSRLGQR